MNSLFNKTVIKGDVIDKFKNMNLEVDQIGEKN